MPEPSAPTPITPEEEAAHMPTDVARGRTDPVPVEDLPVHENRPTAP